MVRGRRLGLSRQPEGGQSRRSHAAAQRAMGSGPCARLSWPLVGVRSEVLALSTRVNRVESCWRVAVAGRHVAGTNTSVDRSDGCDAARALRRRATERCPESDEHHLRRLRRAARPSAFAPRRSRRTLGSPRLVRPRSRPCGAPVLQCRDRDGVGCRHRHAREARVAGRELSCPSTRGRLLRVVRYRRSQQRRRGGPGSTTPSPWRASLRVRAPHRNLRSTDANGGREVSSSACW